MNRCFSCTCQGISVYRILNPCEDRHCLCEIGWRIWKDIGIVSIILIPFDFLSEATVTVTDVVPAYRKLISRVHEVINIICRVTFRSPERREALYYSDLRDLTRRVRIVAVWCESWCQRGCARSCYCALAWHDCNRVNNGLPSTTVFIETDSDSLISMAIPSCMWCPL